MFSELFNWSYTFVLQDSLLKQNYYQEYINQSCWFSLFTPQSPSVQLYIRDEVVQQTHRCDIGLMVTLTAEWRCCRAGVICVPVLGRVVWHRQSAAHCKSAATMKTQSTGRCEISVGPAPNSQSLTTNNDTSHTMSIKQIKWDFNAGKTAN